MKLANERALALGHEYIGTEHVLIGFVKEANGVAATVLKNLGLNLGALEAELAKSSCAGLVLDFGRESLKLPVTPALARAIELAHEEARSFQHNYVGTEHLLLGILREPDGVAAQVLASFAVSLAAVREMVQDLLGVGMTPSVATSPRNDCEPRHESYDHLPDYARRIALIFDQEIEQLREHKEEAIAWNDFELAASFRDQCEGLKGLRDDFLSNWRKLETK